MWPCRFDLTDQTLPTEAIPRSYSWPELGRRLAAAICRFAPDVVVGFAIRSAPLALRHLYRSGKFSARFLDMIQSDIPSEYARVRANSDFASGVAGVSEGCVQRACREIPELQGRIFRLYYPVPCSSTPPSLDLRGGRIRLAYLGLVRHHEKRVLDFIPLVSELLARKVDFELTIIGDGTERQQLEQALLGLPGTPTRVRFLGMLSNPEALRALSCQHALLLLSDVEGQPIAMLEAMALGVVPVVSDLPGLREIIVSGKTGFLAPVGATVAFASHIEHLARHSEIRAEMALAAWRQVCNNHETRTAVGRFAELLEIVRRLPSPNTKTLAKDTYLDSAMNRHRIPQPIQGLKRRFMRQVIF